VTHRKLFVNDHHDLARLGRPHQTMALRMSLPHAQRQRKLAQRSRWL
jgi:hypothetical protein